MDKKDVDNIDDCRSQAVKNKEDYNQERIKKREMLDEEEDCNSDTGLSSLNSSSADDQFQLDTLV